MRFKTVRVQTRPSADIPFFHDIMPMKDEFIRYFIDTFVKTGKIVASDKFETPDKLSVTTMYIWVNREAFLEFMVDEFCFDKFSVPGIEYDTKHGIIAHITGEELPNVQPAHY